MIETVPISGSSVTEIRKGTVMDNTMQELMRVIQNGWPDSRDSLSPKLKHFHTFRDGLVFKGERLVVPERMRDRILAKLHASHMGVQSTLRRAREVVY